MKTSSTSPSMLTDRVDGPLAWTRDTIRESDWCLPIPEDCLAELAQVAEELRYHPIPTLL